MWPLCSQDILKISLINNWWYRNPPAKRQQAPAAPSHCQERGTSSCKSSRLPSDRTSSSPTNWSQLLQVLHVSFCPATSSPQHRTLPDKLLTLIFPHQQLPQTSQADTELNLLSCRTANILSWHFVHWCFSQEAKPAHSHQSQHFEIGKPRQSSAIRYTDQKNPNKIYPSWSSV